jgi:2-hydroxy-6-oxonona-2,4-dienedioate hydrolase
VGGPPASFRPFAPAKTGRDRARLVERRTDVDGVSMFALVSERTPRPGEAPLVFVQGLMVASDFLRPMLVRMGTDHVVAGPDLPGFGKSDKPGDPLDIPALAQALEGWIDAQRYARVCLVGCSLGTQIAVDLAARRPELVERLALIGPVMAPRLRSVPRALLRWQLQLPMELTQMPITVRDFARGGLRRAVATFRTMLTYRMEDRIPALTMPTLVVRGGLDPLVPQDWAAQVAAALPDGRLRVLTGHGHSVNFTAPDALAEALRGFLAGPATVRSPLTSRTLA